MEGLNGSVDSCSDGGDEDEGIEWVSRAVLLQYNKRISRKYLRRRFVTRCKLRTVAEYFKKS